MGCVTCDSLKNHIIEHEILGTTTSSVTNVEVDGGILWVYDDTRSKWLSAERLIATAGRRGRTKNIYLRLIDGQASNLAGYRIPRDGTIVSISAQTRGTETWVLRVRKNGLVTNVASLSVSAAAGAHDVTLDVDVDESDRIEMYADTTAFFGIKDPFVMVEIAWRNDTLPAP